MREQNHQLTFEETEQLCRLYLDCRLSVLEEAELQYVLGKLPYESPIIDEVRMLAGIVLRPQVDSKALRSRRRHRIMRLMTGMAASIVLAIGIFFSITWRHDVAGPSVIAYENGQRLNQQKAQAAVEASIAKAEALMADAKAIEQANYAKQTYIMNISNISK
ncbi:MAG: hypothetical protein J6L73_02665 [Muribaculaceae bacterium]|nr:hypothetical protein [Muribaculaceae bacterium]